MLKRLKKKQRNLNRKIRRAKREQAFIGVIEKYERRVAKVALEIRDYLNRRLSQEEQRAVNIIRENPKFFWSFANSKRKTKSRILPLQKEDGNLTDDPKEKAELLQTQYTSVFSDPSRVTVRGCVHHIPEPDIFRSYRFSIYQGTLLQSFSEKNDRYPPANAILCPHLSNSTNKLCSNTWLSPTRFLKLNDCFKIFFCKSKELLRYIDISIPL